MIFLDFLNYFYLILKLILLYSIRLIVENTIHIY